MSNSTTQFHHRLTTAFKAKPVPGDVLAERISVFTPCVLGFLMGDTEPTSLASNIASELLSSSRHIQTEASPNLHAVMSDTGNWDSDSDVMLLLEMVRHFNAMVDDSKDDILKWESGALNARHDFLSTGIALWAGTRGIDDQSAIEAIGHIIARTSDHAYETVSQLLGSQYA